jgi:hypothetical protein
MSLDVKPSKRLEKIFNNLLLMWYNGSHLNGKYNTNSSQYPKIITETKENVLLTQSSLKVPFVLWPPNEITMEEKNQTEVRYECEAEPNWYDIEHSDEYSSYADFSYNQNQQRPLKTDNNIQTNLENFKHFFNVVSNENFNPTNYTLVALDYFGENVVNEYQHKFKR